MNEKYRIGKKIVVVGPTGGGKTTFAVKLSQFVSIKHYELDSLFWKPDWKESSPEEFREKINDITSQSEWIVDRNYSRNQDLTIGRAETVIWLDSGKYISVYRVLIRSLKRIINKNPLWQENNETLLRLISPKVSIVVFAFQSHKKKKARYTGMFESDKNKNLNVIRIKNKREENKFWKSIIKNPA